MTASDKIVDFSSLALAPGLLKAIQAMGYEVPTPIQAEAIPPLLEGNDLLGQAQTGTGKTAAFALPLLSRLDSKQKSPQILVLAPTRELALQVAEAFQSYASQLPSFHVLPLYGGQSIGLQLRQLQRNPQVIVGTPGRVMDHLRRKSLTLNGLRSLVLDEADEMLNMGFIEDIEWIFDKAPPERQVALFSATMPDAIRRIARKQLRNPIEIKVKNKTETVTTIDQSHCVVTRHHKMDALTRLLEVEAFDGMIIFVRTKTATVEVADKLEAHGFAAEALNGDMNQAMRERTVKRLKAGQLDIIVATDVAARGLDVERISHVVNFDIPNDPESYVHRIGRTGRAGRTGKALLFVQPRERGLLKAIERTTRQPIPAINLPTADDLSEHRIDRFVDMLRETLSEQDLDFYYRLVSRIEKEQETSALDIAAALTFLSQKTRPFIVDELEKPLRKGRNERQERSSEKSDFGKRPKKTSRKRDNSVPFETYRLEVGEKHEASPREIVGAIANEAGLDGQMIGRIDIREDHSLVELPVGMPKDIYQHLRRVFVRGQRLDLHLSEETPSYERQSQKKGKGKKKRKKEKS
ncbi:MAG: DEAD/DEAH box helicase [Candidatus Thiodiazotropha sp. (ex Myrtea spinifera)]|nr:DEAD/DEAH box helicase [Candidatus Thiodiazotropha sp. (ex Myrtea spinifera)]MCU7827627.1 DEAD/DEAH box helicase [Candidatus Thiodiazotropha sp. (ex Myrtea sp. 'scaly one' KF741663)]